MKTIDLLNKIANGDIKYPIRFIEKGIGSEFEIESKDDLANFHCMYDTLNDEIEIIEEPKKIEKLDITLETAANENLHNYLMYAVSMPYRILNDKIDEIIDKINELGE